MQMVIELNKIYNENCLVTMSKMPDGFVDLTITSPPYDNLRYYNGYSFDFELIAEQLFRITKQGGIVVWVVGDATINGSETGTSFKQALYFKKIGFNLHDTMIYQKSGCSMPSPNRYLSNFEYMFIFSKGSPKTYNLICDKKNMFPIRWGKGRKVRNKDGTWSYRENYIAKEYGRRFNVWKYHSGGQGYGHSDNFAREHPATFPEQLAIDHIISWSNTKDLIYDPLAGSGTTLKCCKLLNRNWIGSEISKGYCDIIEKRLNLPVQKKLAGLSEIYPKKH